MLCSKLFCDLYLLGVCNMLKEIKYLNIEAINKYLIVESDNAFYRHLEEEIIYISYLGYGFLFSCWVDPVASSYMETEIKFERIVLKNCFWKKKIAFGVIYLSIISTCFQETETHSRTFEVKRKPMARFRIFDIVRPVSISTFLHVLATILEEFLPCGWKNGHSLFQVYIISRFQMKRRHFSRCL